MTKTQSRVLRALDLLNEVTRSEYEERGIDMSGSEIAGHGWKSLLSAVGVVSTGRRSSERQISEAIRGLVEMEKVEKVVISGGLGQGMTLYRKL